MSEKILIHEDKNRQTTFLKEVEAVRDAANVLAQTFEQFQEFARISTLEQFELLCSDPVQYFDETIKANVSLQMTGGRAPDPQVLADLFGIDRQNYIAVIKGLPVTEGCKPCQTSTIVIKGGKPALSFSRYSTYKEFLTFDAGAFNLNLEAIAARLEQFKTFADTPAQLSLLKHWQSLVAILNEHDKSYPIGNSDKGVVAKGLRLGLAEAISGSFVLNVEYLKNLITSIK